MLYTYTCIYIYIRRNHYGRVLYETVPVLKILQEKDRILPTDSYDQRQYDIDLWRPHV